LNGVTTIQKFDEDLAEFFEEDQSPKENIIKFCKEHIEQCKKKSNLMNSNFLKKRVK